MKFIPAVVGGNPGHFGVMGLLLLGFLLIFVLNISD